MIAASDAGHDGAGGEDGVAFLEQRLYGILAGVTGVLQTHQQRVVVRVVDEGRLEQEDAADLHRLEHRDGLGHDAAGVGQRRAHRELVVGRRSGQRNRQSAPGC